ncbi:hypothetical protein XENTR_v10009108 [Xenopus tropicalis]|uniref:Proprotein convertase subtilisin/kexin type 5 n=1 Tax=Xenopus tropicalis TaxID=8364 RepID=A0A8J0QUB0_XENTR|nr:proprotein convertase subtilisin/kexin type 5 [Xenopus tropicalis]KAE8617533.1 hypothetical protein XENTR_v10009108 [Xenopus tropicalis]
MKSTAKIWFLLIIIMCFNHICAMVCPNGQFALSSQCVDCHSSCEECSGYEPYECIECGIDQDGIERFLHRSRCKIHCPRGFYKEYDTYTCETCPINCELCTDSNNCQKCKINYRLLNGACYLTQCLPGQVEDPETGECLDCESGCKTCTVDDPEICISCLEGYFLYRHQCRKHCPQKTYEDMSRKLCFACPSGCIDCKNDTHCFSCQAGYYLHGNVCLPKCPDGTFQDSKIWQCEECHGSCRSCHGPSATDCDLCPDQKKPIYGMCHILACSDGHYFNVPDGKCYKCHSSCQSCFGPEELNCLSCYTGHFLSEKNKCHVNCPEGFFGDLSSKTCVKCSATCEICRGYSDDCLKCKGDDEHRLFLHKGNCLPNCPEGYFENAAGSCEACDTSCWACDENKMKCLSCVEGLYLESSKCKPNCSLKYFPDDDGICKRCPAHCNFCKDENTCLECSYLYFLFNGTCKATCPDGYYEDLDAVRCIPCHFSCQTCSGTSEDDCETCLDSTHKLYQGRCLTDCTVGTFFNSAISECQDCHKTCSKCSGPEPTDCIQCQNSLSMDPESGMCGVEGDANCPPKTFLQNDLFTCSSCDRTCKSCNGPSPKHCLTCTVPFYLHKTTCVSQCPPGTYNTTEEADGMKLGFCSQCHQVCTTCHGGSAKDCDMCSSGYYKLLHLCILHCPPGYYKENNQCEKCDPHCQLCGGPGLNGCLACPSNTLQIEGTTHCVKQCPERFYSYKDRCRKCHPSCRTCNDSSVQGCLTCDRGSDFKAGICYPRCEEQRYLDSDGVCQLCDASCRHCSGPRANHCISCKTNTAWSPTEMKCIKCCDSEMNQDDCCFCDVNSVLCIRHLQAEAEEESLKNLNNKLPHVISHYAAIAPVLVFSIGMGAVFVFCMRRAKAKRKLCWEHSYERLGGSLHDATFYDYEDERMGLRKATGAEEDSLDESDVIYSTQDGTVYKKFSFKPSRAGKDMEHDQACI